MVSLGLYELGPVGVVWEPDISFTVLDWLLILDSASQCSDFYWSFKSGFGNFPAGPVDQLGFNAEVC